MNMRTGEKIAIGTAIGVICALIVVLGFVVAPDWLKTDKATHTVTTPTSAPVVSVVTVTPRATLTVTASAAVAVVTAQSVPTIAPVPVVAPRPEPKATTTPPVALAITAGAFCAPNGATGHTDTGLVLECTASSTDVRNRWREVAPVQPTPTPTSSGLVTPPASVPAVVADPPPVTTATITTPPPAPVVPGAVVVTSTSTVADTATFTWTPPSSSSSPITGYYVARDGSDSNGTGPWNTTTSSVTRSWTFTHLLSGTAYTLTIVAINSAGMGPSTSVVIHTS